MCSGYVVITGASGFIGSALLNSLRNAARPVRAVTRHKIIGADQSVVAVGDIGPETAWGDALKDADCVIHAAGFAHLPNDSGVDLTPEFRRVNALGTARLAREAAASGVRRFVFISSIGVNGSSNSRPFSEVDLPNPCGPYAVSKLEAERALATVSSETGMEVVIIRPPLVYGPNAPGAFGRLLKAVESQTILPLGAIHNRRSLVALDNLIDLSITCIDHPAAANQTFLVSDGEDLSTTELLRRIAKALGKPVRLLPVPVFILTAGAAVLGKQSMARKLCQSLQVDSGKARKMLDWAPPVSVDDALSKTARVFLQSKYPRGETGPVEK